MKKWSWRAPRALIMLLCGHKFLLFVEKLCAAILPLSSAQADDTGASAAARQGRRTDGDRTVVRKDITTERVGPTLLPLRKV